MKHTLLELKDMAKKLGLVGYSKLKKEELLHLISKTKKVSPKRKTSPKRSARRSTKKASPKRGGAKKKITFRYRDEGIGFDVSNEIYLGNDSNSIGEYIYFSRPNYETGEDVRIVGFYIDGEPEFLEIMADLANEDIDIVTLGYDTWGPNNIAGNPPLFYHKNTEMLYLDDTPIFRVHNFYGMMEDLGQITYE